MQPLETHPRPQLTRSRWTDLCGTWGFAYDDEDVGRQENWFNRANVFDRSITVPFPPESPASGIGDPAPHPVIWYRRTFHLAPEDYEHDLLLHFGAVDYRASVWVNGLLVAEHEGGHTPFSANITTVLRRDEREQVIVVRAEDQLDDLTQPRGKQFWRAQPEGIWYERTTGIWQMVWLEPVPSVHIVNLRWTPDLDRGVLSVEATLNRVPPHPLSLNLHLTLHGATLANDTYTVEHAVVRRDITLDAARLTQGHQQILWSPEHPNLIDAVLTLRDGEQVIDTVQSYAGMRSIDCSDGRFRLNGRRYYLRMVLEQGYWPESHLAAPSDAALRREVELIKELGFNAARIHQKVEDPRFLYWCDRLGLIVWGEMANAYVFSPTAAERLTREWLDVVRRDYSHPCIVAWVPINESWGVPNLARDPAQQQYVRALYHLTRTIDPTRPVMGNEGWEHITSDILGIHDYAFYGETLRQRYGSRAAIDHTTQEQPPTSYRIVLAGFEPKGVPVMITEFGGISYKPAPGELWFGYGTVENPDQFLAKYAELIDAVYTCPDVVGFCYTQFTDTGQETNGLLNADRTPKLDITAIRAITTRQTR